MAVQQFEEQSRTPPRTAVVWLVAMVAVACAVGAFAQSEGGLPGGGQDSEPHSSPSTVGTVAASASDPLSIVGDPYFRATDLSGQMRLWYDRLRDSMDATRDYIDQRSRSGDLYLLGRSLNNYVTALLMGLRATGDLSLLDRAAELWENARADLRDAWCDGTTDGYVNWLWLTDRRSSHYCKDTHQMDESMTHGAVALIAFALNANRHLDPDYAAKADFWIDYLENHFLAKWYSRAGDRVLAWEDSSVGFYKRFTHPRSNQLRLAYYLHEITGDSFYAQRAAVIEAQLANHPEVNPTVTSAYQWLHNVSGSNTGYQQINYAQYYMNVLLEMNAEQFGVYSQDSEMSRYMSTFRDVVLTKFGTPWDSMALTVDGAGSTSTQLGCLSGFARWDNTHLLLDIADARYTPSRDGLYMAGAALLALSNRNVSGSGTLPLPPRDVRRSDRR